MRRRRRVPIQHSGFWCALTVADLGCCLVLRDNLVVAQVEVWLISVLKVCHCAQISKERAKGYAPGRLSATDALIREGIYWSGHDS